jgi:hypothetical protein
MELDIANQEAEAAAENDGGLRNSAEPKAEVAVPQ